MLRYAVIGISLSILLSGCGTFVPNQQETWEGDKAVKYEKYIKDHVYCELQQAVQNTSSGPSRVNVETRPRFGNTTLTHGLPADWGAQITLSFQVDETGAVNPGLTLIRPLSTTNSYTTGLGATLSSQAERIDKYEFYYSVADLAVPTVYGKGPDANNCLQHQNSSFLSDNLRIGEWLQQALYMRNDYPSGKQTANTDPAFKQDVLSYETKFIVITSGNATPQLKLLRVATNQGSLPFLSENRTRTHDLIITLGPSQKAGKPGSKAKPGEASEPASIASNSHLASEIGLAVSNQLASRPLQVQ